MFVPFPSELLAKKESFLRFRNIVFNISVFSLLLIIFSFINYFDVSFTVTIIKYRLILIIVSVIGFIYSLVTVFLNPIKSFIYKAVVNEVRRIFPYQDSIGLNRLFIKTLFGFTDTKKDLHDLDINHLDNISEALKKRYWNIRFFNIWEIDKEKKIVFSSFVYGSDKHQQTFYGSVFIEKKEDIKNEFILAKKGVLDFFRKSISLNGVTYNLFSKISDENIIKNDIQVIQNIRVQDFFNNKGVYLLVKPGFVYFIRLIKDIPKIDIKKDEYKLMNNGVDIYDICIERNKDKLKNFVDKQIIR